MSEDNSDPIQLDHQRPLDSLLPDLAETRTPPPRAPVHQRVLSWQSEQGELGLLFIIWDDPGGAAKVFEQLGPVVEATLLSMLSVPPGTQTLEQIPAVLHLVCFPELHAVEAAVAAFGFRPFDDPQGVFDLDAIAGTARQEAESMGASPPTTIPRHFRAHVGHRQRLLRLQREMLSPSSDTPKFGATFGDIPGGPSKALVHAIERHAASPTNGAGDRPTPITPPSIEPTLRGLAALEAQCVPRETGEIRWMPPLVFQALCDFVGIVAHMDRGATVQWAVSEADNFGLHTPPILRAVVDGEPAVVPVGLHILRWCIMPLREDEEVASLAEWVADQFR